LRVPYADAMLKPIPAELSEEQALFVGDILSTGYMACGESGDIRAGNVWLFLAQVRSVLCALASAPPFRAQSVISVDVLDYRLDVAKRLGADIVINANG